MNDTYLIRLLEEHNRKVERIAVQAEKQAGLMERQVSALESIAESLRKIETPHQ